MGKTGSSMRNIQTRGGGWLGLLLASSLLYGCGAPKFSEQEVRAVPYEIGRSNVIPVTVDLQLEAEIPELRRIVHPDGEIGGHVAYPLRAGNALSDALLKVTESHFDAVNSESPHTDGPRVEYTLLEYKPEIRFAPSGVATSSYATARVAVRAELYRGPIEVMSAVVFGSGHVTDSKLLDRFGAGPQLLEAATHDAIIDAMYELSAFYDNNRQLITERLNPPPPSAEPRPFDDVVLYLETHKHGD